MVRTLAARALFFVVPVAFIAELAGKLVAGEPFRPALLGFAAIALYALYEVRGRKRAERVLVTVAIMVGGFSVARALGWDLGGPDTAAALLALGGVGILLIVMSARPSWILSAMYAAAVLGWVVVVSGLEGTSTRDLVVRLGMTLGTVGVATWLVGQGRQTLAGVTEEQAARLRLQDSVSAAVKAVVIGGSAGLQDAAAHLREGARVAVVVIERYRGAKQRLIPNEVWTSGSLPGFDPGLDGPIDPLEASTLTEGGSVERTGLFSERVVPIRGLAGVLGSVRLVTDTTVPLAGPEADNVASLAEIVGVTWRREAAEELADRRQGRLEAESRREDALATVAKSLLVTKGDESLVSSVAALVRSTSADIGVIGRISDDDPDYQCLVVGMESGSGIVTSRARVAPDDQVLRALAEGRSVEWGQRVTEFPADLRRAGVESMLVVPVRARGSLVGSVALASREPGYLWPSGDRSVLERAAVLIGAFWEGEDNESTLRELLRSKDRFIASVSHELRTPLTAVLGLATALAETDGDLSDEERYELASVVAEQAGDVSFIVEDLLVAARAESEMLTIVPGRVEVDSEVAQVIDRFDLDVELDANCQVTAYADVHRVRQILRNLVTNAVRYGGDRVVVTTSASGSDVEVQVSDNGEGVAPEQVDHIFDPYVRAHSAVGNPDSVGLGLAVARQLARLMGGDVIYRRTDVTTFSFTLPRYPSASTTGSVGMQPAVDEDFAPAQIASLLAGEEDSESFEVLGISPAAKRHP